jgi:sugar phosphate isomerase/epimerase
VADTVHWDRRNREHRDRFAVLLTPLILASRTKDYETPEKATAQLHTWMISFQEVHESIIAEAISIMVNRGIEWMPKPRELKEQCAKVMAEKRKAAAALHLDGCIHSSHWIELDGVNQRCECWKRAIAAAEAVGQQIALPPMPREDQQELLGS